MNSIYKMMNGEYVDLSKIVQIGNVSDEINSFYDHSFMVFYQLRSEGVSIFISKEDRYENDEIALAKHPYEVTERVGFHQTPQDMLRDIYKTSLSLNGTKQLREDLIKAWKEYTGEKGESTD